MAKCRVIKLLAGFKKQQQGEPVNPGSEPAKGPLPQEGGGYETVNAIIRSEEKTRAQQEACAERIFLQLLPFIRAKVVTRVVDIGCGSGVTLEAIAKKIKTQFQQDPAGLGQTSFELLGIDMALPDDVQPENDGPIKLEFHKDSFFAMHGIKIDNSTAVLCLGHAIFHFHEGKTHLDDFFNKIKEAPIVILDVHKNWDEALEYLGKAGPEGSGHFEPLQYDSDNGITWWLKTELDDPGFVKRGRFNGKENRFELATKQLGWERQTLKGHFDQRGFELLVEWEQFSPWGPMHSSVYVKKVPEEINTLHERYLEFMQATIDDQLQDEALQEFKKLMVCCRFLVVMPYDRMRTLGRYAKASFDKSEWSAHPYWEQIFKYKLLLDSPKPGQSNYPLGYGFYSTVLGPFSSSMALPLDTVLDYKMNEHDQVVARIEAGGVAADGSPDEGFLTKEKDSSADSAPLFLLPFYYGCIPLFIAVIRPSKLVFGDSSALDPEFTWSMLRHFSGTFRRKLDEGNFRYRLVSFLAESACSLRGNEENEEADAKRILEGWIANLEAKPWKSWISAVPSKPIRQIVLIQDIQRGLRKSMLDEITLRTSKDIFISISKALEKYNFFLDSSQEGGAGHAEVTRAHQAITQIDDFKQKITRAIERCEISDHISNKIKYWFEKIENWDSDRNFYFNILKELFCRGNSNRGAEFRFSTPRMYLTLWLAFEINSEEHSLFNRARKILETGNNQGCLYHQCALLDPTHRLFQVLNKLRSQYVVEPRVDASFEIPESDPTKQHWTIDFFSEVTTHSNGNGLSAILGELDKMGITYLREDGHLPSSGKIAFTLDKAPAGWKVEWGKR